MVDITSLKARLARLRLASEEPYNEYTKNIGGKRKKKNKLTRSDQKRGKFEANKLRAHRKKNKIQGPNYEKGYDTLNEYFDYIPEEDRASVDKTLKKYGL